jgi:hypothetical protein
LCREASMALGDCSAVSEDQRGQLVGGAGGEHVYVCIAPAEVAGWGEVDMPRLERVVRYRW